MFEKFTDKARKVMDAPTAKEHWTPAISTPETGGLASFEE